ncbi:MAG: DUF2336 domain-containing protein [Alphaproteobacteria bacterium]|nr:DUF2336 domain-containing protein [Alphaproteobacteria bacterium]
MSATKRLSAAEIIDLLTGAENPPAPPVVELPAFVPLNATKLAAEPVLAPEPPPAEASPAVAVEEEAFAPPEAPFEPAPVEIETVQPEELAAPPPPPQIADESFAPEPEVPVLATELEPQEPEPQTFEPVVAAPEPPPAEPVIEPAPPPHAPAAIEAAPELPEGKDPPAAPALTDRLADAMMKTVREAVYARPTAADRAAFLRDVAALMEEEKGEEQIITAAQAVSPIAAMIEAARKAAAAAPPPRQPAIAASAAVDVSPPQPASGLQSETFAPPAKPRVMIPAMPEPRLEETPEADEASGELALSLLDMMSAGAGSGLPHERALAADTLLRLVPRVPVKQLVTIVERLAIMENPPALLVAKLIRDPRAEVVAPLLERCMHITDQDLTVAAVEGDAAKRRMIARRRAISPVLSDHLMTGGDTSVLLTLIRNPGAAFSHEAFYRLAEEAARHQALLAPLATRADLPVPVAFELLWFLPHELRRFIFSRFLNDSETLNRILKITLGGNASANDKFPPRAKLDEAIERAAAGALDEAATMLAAAGNINRDTAARVLGDGEGEPLTVAHKAMGYPRGNFLPAIEKLRTAAVGTLRADRNLTELESIFDSLSFNKARILLTYWDWFVTKSGPYAPHN